VQRTTGTIATLAGLAVAAALASRVRRRMRRASVAPRSLRGALFGTVGGLVGSAVMNGVHGVWTRAEEVLRPEQAKHVQSADDSATTKTAEEVSRRLLHRDLPERKKAAASLLVHYAFGATMGAVYGVLAELVPAASRGRGAVFGMALWLGADEALVPTLRLSKPPTHYPLSTHARALVAHVVYGLVTDGVRRVFLAVR
jgi:uncharacterized membrane protein YagU involved in acid resistance